MSIEFIKVDPRASLNRATDGSAGYDLVACIDAPIVLEYGQPAKLISTGLKIHIESQNVVGLIFPRSGLGHKSGLVLGNAIGVIDSDYFGVWYVSAWNRGAGMDADGNHPSITINPGDRIAQVVFAPVIHPVFVEVEEFGNGSGRGEGGFGSTGVTKGKNEG